MDASTDRTLYDHRELAVLDAIVAAPQPLHRMPLADLHTVNQLVAFELVAIADGMATATVEGTEVAGRPYVTQPVVFRDGTGVVPATC